jgi:hypothetical protein
VITLAMIAMLVTSCGRATDVATKDDTPPPGTILHGSVDVVDGTELVGSVFPFVNPNSARSAAPTSAPPDGWQALLTVTGDPIDAWNAYAKALGVDDLAGAIPSCEVSAVTAGPIPPPDESWPVVHRRLTEPRLDGENRLECAATVGAVTMSLVVGVARRCEPAVGGPKTHCDLRRVAHLLIRVQAPDQPTTDRPSVGPESAYDEHGTRAAATSGTVVRPRLSTKGATSVLPGPGQSIDDGLDYYLQEGLGAGSTSVFTVPRGGRSLVAPALLIQCNSGLVAALRLEGTPRQVADGFDAQGTQDDPMVRAEGDLADGHSWVSGEIATAGGYYLDVAAVAVDDGHSDVLVTECGD